MSDSASSGENFESLTSGNLAALQSGDLRNAAIILLACQCWMDCPSYRSSDVVENIRDRSRIILNEFCRCNNLDGVYPTRIGSVDALKTWVADTNCEPAIRREIVQRILIAQGANLEKQQLQLMHELENARDTSNDAKKKPRQSPKRGPRRSSEFMRFKVKMQGAERKHQSKMDAALEFADGDQKKAKALLRKYYRHKDLPE